MRISAACVRALLVGLFPVGREVGEDFRFRAAALYRVQSPAARAALGGLQAFDPCPYHSPRFNYVIQEQFCLFTPALTETNFFLHCSPKTA